MKQRERFSGWENSPGDFIILIISAEVWNTENNKNGKIQKVRLIELYYLSEMCFWMFLKLKMSSMKDILHLLYLIFPLVKASKASPPGPKMKEPRSGRNATLNNPMKPIVKCRVFSRRIGHDVLSDQPFKSHTSHSNNLLHAFHWPLGEGGQFP